MGGAYSVLPYITFYVRNFQGVVEFYRDMLGLEVEHLNDGFVRFRTASGFMLAFHYAEQPIAPRPRPEIHFEVPDVDAAYAELQARGVKFESAPADTPWGQRMAACLDPAGLSIEFISPTPP